MPMSGVCAMVEYFQACHRCVDRGFLFLESAEILGGHRSEFVANFAVANQKTRGSKYCGKPNHKLNLPFWDGLYHPFRVVLGVAYCWAYHIVVIDATRIIVATRSSEKST